MLFGICLHTSCTPKFWHSYVVIHSNFMIIVEPCHGQLLSCTISEKPKDSILRKISDRWTDRQK